jgi:hypothetical protein
MKGNVSQRIDASPEAIFEYVHDLEKHVEWNHQPVSITKVSEGPVGPGARYVAMEQSPSSFSNIVATMMSTMLRLMFGATGQTEAEITDYQPATRIAWKSAAIARGGHIMKANWSIDLNPGDQGTELTQRFEFFPQTALIDRISNDSQAAKIKEEVARNLSVLKGQLEHETAASYNK